ncbi:MAG: glycerol kinase GlpK [Leptospiraceae bacterium]|nr:glycerol kinase GlpK [Leptospiraceae bacterium]MDW7976963.1 glycerol kinase GlpK [Leptospiraceae bacterium]
MGQKYILSIDHGTTGSRVFCFSEKGEIISSSYREFTQHFPKAGWVEHDPEEIWAGLLYLIQDAINKGDLDSKDAIAIGITNQRETVVLWDKKTQKPIYNAIVWQCRRTAKICEELKEKGYENIVRNKTGLVIDAYFSGTKIQWILDHVEGARDLAKNGRLQMGTMDSWILYKLTGEHKTDFTNASRTMIFNIKQKEWDEELLEILNIPKNILPEVLPSRANFGTTKNVQVLPDGIPVYAMIGDQQAALFGQLCVHPGEAKNTYGTGCFLLFQTGNDFILSNSGLLTTLACDKDGNPTYALEGAVFIAGAVIQWLRDYMKFFATAKESEELIKDLKDDDEVVFVPAFVGLGAPYWDMKARGAIFGLTRDTSPARITRAALKSIALQTYDLVHAMEKDTGKKLPFLRVDGGATSNQFLLQYQADILNRKVERPKNIDTTAAGSAYLAGIQAGIWKDAEELSEIMKDKTIFEPKMSEVQRKKELHYWHKAVERVKNWSE